MDPFAIASKFEIRKDLVDAVVRHRQSELRNHPDLEVVKNAVLANLPYEQVAALCGLQVHEVAWLAKRIRAEHKRDLESLAEREESPEWFADIAYADVGAIQLDMEEQKRRYFSASEWTAAKHWKRSKKDSRSNMMFAYTLIDVMDIYATTPDRKDRLRWFRTTIAETIVHRRELKRKHATKAALAHHSTELQGTEVDFIAAA
jgi:hypothetical protein